MRASALLLTAAAAAGALTITGCGPEAAPTGSAVAYDAARPPASATASAVPSPSPSSSAPTVAPPASSAPPASAKPPAAKASSQAAASHAAQPAALKTSFGYSATADAAGDVAAALRQAKADGRNVLLDFGANWCGNCQALDRLYASAQVQGALNASYHLVQVDIGDHVTANMNLLQKYDSSGSYQLPVLIVVTPGGKVTADTARTGLPSLNADGVNAFLHKWAP